MRKWEDKRDTALNKNARRDNFLRLSPAIERLISAYPLLKHEEEQQLARDGSDGARDLLVLSNLRLVKSIVKAFQGCGIEPNDLFSEGVKGLVKASKRYIPDKGRFATYARHTIRGEIMDYIDKNRTFTHVPKPLRKEVNRFRETLEKFGGTATDATLAENMGCSLKKIRYLRMCSEQSTYSVSVPLADEDMDRLNSTENMTVIETLWVDDIGFAAVETALDLTTFLSCLPSVEAEVLRLRWGINETEPLSLRAVAVRLRKGKTWVANTEKTALKKLRKIADEEKKHSIEKKTDASEIWVNIEDEDEKSPIGGPLVCSDEMAFISGSLLYSERCL